ncbi:density-regulated protein homolog [Octopus sinensis]|uniref:Density-regulated protein n=1 Tax=Octopus sinensis TaxID=2607531 RepID=A0A6P7THB3_9MOLL|nr:density-regulated protein homolog [Octopus sinensis]XP_036369303.1 density-regulated protein homolog [Octopus sinensis]XP_036369304.1 density-regulated protein homolog [Octopus sinensis]
MTTAIMDNSKFFVYDGPRKDVNYPIEVLYCGECTMPVEYCEYYPNYERCKIWLEKNMPDQFKKLMAGKGDENLGSEETEEKKKRQTRGGRGVIKAKKKTEPQGLKLSTATRGKKKRVTIVAGLATYDIDLKEASKYFATKFSCGSSVTADEIVIQGDVKDELFDIIPEKWPQIDEDNIDDLGEQKK